MFDRLRAALRNTTSQADETERKALATKTAATEIPDAPLTDGLEYIIDSNTGRTIGEKHTKDGQLHRDNDLPALLYYDECGERESWFQHGLGDRATGPAEESHDTQGGYEARYLRQGVRHNDDGPAVVIDDRDSVVREWWKDGILESRFQEFRDALPDYQAPGGAQGGVSYRQEVFDSSGKTVFVAASDTDPYRWGERWERFEGNPTAHERLFIEAKLNEQKAYFDTIGGMSPYETAPAFGHFREEEPQETETAQPDLSSPDTQQDRAKGPISQPQPSHTQETPMSDQQRTPAKPADGLIQSAQPADGRVVSEEWFYNGQPTARPGGVKAAAAAAAAKQAQPEVIAKTGLKKARDDNQR